MPNKKYILAPTIGGLHTHLVTSCLPCVRLRLDVDDASTRDLHEAAASVVFRFGKHLRESYLNYIFYRYGWVGQ